MYQNLHALVLPSLQPLTSWVPLTPHPVLNAQFLKGAPASCLRAFARVVPFVWNAFPWLTLSLRGPWKPFLPVRLELLDGTASAIPICSRAPAPRWIQGWDRQVQNQKLLSKSKTPPRDVG